jgi:hypothetical protein
VPGGGGCVSHPERAERVFTGTPGCRAVVELDGKTYRVIRNGKGASRLDRKSDDPVSDGEITLKDLEARLKAQGRSSIDAVVQTQEGSFPGSLDPSSAMCHQGRHDGENPSATHRSGVCS